MGALRASPAFAEGAPVAIERLLQLSFRAQLADPALRVPTLIVYGAAERGAAAGADSLRALIPGARVEALPGAGHFAFVEQPAAFLALVRASLTDCCS